VPGREVSCSLLARLTPELSYAAEVLPSLFILGLGFGLIFVPAISSATHGVGGQDAGVASAVVTTMQQVGGSVGTALLSTVAANFYPHLRSDAHRCRGAGPRRRARPYHRVRCVRVHLRRRRCPHRSAAALRGAPPTGQPTAQRPTREAVRADRCRHPRAALQQGCGDCGLSDRSALVGGLPSPGDYEDHDGARTSAARLAAMW